MDKGEAPGSAGWGLSPRLGHGPWDRPELRLASCLAPSGTPASCSKGTPGLSPAWEGVLPETRLRTRDPPQQAFLQPPQGLPRCHQFLQLLLDHGSPFRRRLLHHQLAVRFDQG